MRGFAVALSLALVAAGCMHDFGAFDAPAGGDTAGGGGQEAGSNDAPIEVDSEAADAMGGQTALDAPAGVPDAPAIVDAPVAVLDARADVATEAAPPDAKAAPDAPCTPSPSCLSTAETCAKTCDTALTTCDAACKRNDFACMQACETTARTYSGDCVETCTSCTESAGCPAQAQCTTSAAVGPP
jgi:hypothetical protein